MRIRCQASLDGNDWVKQDGRAGGHEAPGWGWMETEPASNEECWAAGEQGRAGQGRAGQHLLGIFKAVFMV